MPGAPFRAHVALATINLETRRCLTVGSFNRPLARLLTASRYFTHFGKNSMAESKALEDALQQIDFARRYSSTLIADIDDDDWFCIPSGNVSHVAWQVGHLAMAEYMLALFRLRGKQDEDTEFISKSFIRTFLKGTTPTSDASAYPSPTEIRSTYDGVHRQVLSELSDYSLDELDETVVEPYAVYPNRLGSLLFCAAHEMLHAGQIGVLRRQLGNEPRP